MIEALGDRGKPTALLEVPGTDERQQIPDCPNATLEWLERGAVSPGRSLLLIDGARTVHLEPDGTHAYIAGELSIVASVRQVLVERGLAPEHISAKAYWRLGVANASHGEPEGD